MNSLNDISSAEVVQLSRDGLTNDIVTTSVLCFMEELNIENIALAIEHHFEKVGERNISAFAKKAKVSRTTIHDILARKNVSLSIDRAQNILQAAGFIACISIILKEKV